MTNWGEEGQNVGSVAALKDTDVIFPQYREAAGLIWRGFDINRIADQLTSNYREVGKGR